MNQQHKDKILVLTSYPPRQCGIATYSSDLIRYLKKQFGSNFDISVCALENDNIKRNYPEEVEYVINVLDYKNHIRLADMVNRDPQVKSVVIQHEFGLYGGDYGENLIYFLYSLRKPAAITFHTVLPDPEPRRKSIVASILDAVNDVIVMTENAAKILEKHYDLGTSPVHIIPHGTHLSAWKDKNELKFEYGLGNKTVLSTFGLLSSNKSIETALHALPDVITKHPDAVYLIMGKTHPEVLKIEGEQYRNHLKEIVREKKLKDHVFFIDEYLDLEKLLDYLSLSDLYLFTSKDRHQAVSGTFSYAMNCACPVIATGIPHALEWIDEGTGRIIDFQAPEQLSENILELLDDPEKLRKMSMNAFHKSRPTLWNNVVIPLAKILEQHTDKKLHYDLPEIKLDHLQNMTDAVGMVQFSKISIPDPYSGYTLDDNARALVAVCQYHKEKPDEKNIYLINHYLRFIHRCQEDDGTFVNYIDSDGNVHDENMNVNLEDSNGRAIWALGTIMEHGAHLENKLVSFAEKILCKALPMAAALSSPRAMSFTIKGLYKYYRYGRDKRILKVIESHADVLSGLYEETASHNWHWFENYLTYANSTLPEAMLYSYMATGKKEYKVIAKITFDFILSRIFHGDSIKVISNNGWFHRHRPANRFGEQPIDVAYTIEALDVFSRIFPSEDYDSKIRTAFSWFLGNNHLNEMIYNPVSGGCHDGLEEFNVNQNEGAESLTCYLMARITAEAYQLPIRKELPVSETPESGKPVSLPGKMRSGFTERLVAGFNALPVLRSLFTF